MFLIKLVFLIVLFLTKNSISAQNQAPKFDPPLQPNYFVPEYDATKPGDLLLWLNATDNDDLDLNFGVEGDYGNKLISVQKVSGKNAMVLIKKKFDRETQEKYENIVFYVKDKPGNKVYQSVRLIITDIDDNPPVFKNLPYKINVNENQQIDTVVFDGIEAFDADGPMYNKFHFTLSDSEYFGFDKTNYLKDGAYSTNLILKKKLDYEDSKSHLLKIKAIGENSVHSAMTEILINVIDYPDKKPEFSQSPYYVRIIEEMNIGDVVIQVSAKDGDSGINNLCRYELINSDTSCYFEINSETGVITIKKRIDLESDELIRLGGLLEIEVKAVEIGDEASFETAKITIAVLDINDNYPTFNKDSYNLIISPKCLEGASLTLNESIIDTIRVYDPDKGINGSFSLALASTVNEDNFENNFSIDFEVSPKIALNDANLIIKLKNSSNLLKNIGKTQRFDLIAKDNGVDGKSVKVGVFIKIENINEYAPKFEKKEYTLYVDENSIYNTTVGYLKAYDNDTFGDFGKLFYELKNGQERFQIDKFTGRVYTISENPNFQLDRESVDVFYMNIEAIDGGGLRTSVQLIIKLNDLNDNAPQFINNFNNKINSEKMEDFLVGWIEENSQKWIEPLKIKAYDRDIGKNGLIEYEIIEGDCYKDFFYINNLTQQIELKENLTLDFEQIYYLKQKNYLNLKSISHEFPNYMLNPGEIDINLIIEARDLGRPSLSSKIIVKIVVKDLNDNKPKFEQSFYTAQILETASFGEIIQVNAIDLDAPNTANSKVIYSIETGNKEKFSIDSTSGVISINENANLDRDLHGTVHKLKILANDFDSLNSKTQIKNSDENYCFVIIEIVDVNNKMPKFINNPEIVTIEENSPIYTHIFQFKAHDLDSNSKLNYFLIENDSRFDEKMTAYDEKGLKVDIEMFRHWFDINPQNGSLYTKGNIDREVAETVQLIIGVEDLNFSDDYQNQISTIKLQVKIIDVNDNFPLFTNLRQINSDHVLTEGEEPIFELYETIDENSKINTTIYKLKASDKDKDNNITYKVININDSNKSIMVGKYNGEIYINNLIDYENLKWINLTILVNDNGKPSQKHSIVYFYCRINDLNDNAPKFDILNKTDFEIFENNLENYFITQLTAFDMDSDLYGPINFKIINSYDQKFSIEKTSGRLYAKKSLDREQQSYYNLVIEARDNPNGLISNQLTDTINLKVILLDQNDNKPKCEQDFYTIETSQNVDVGTILYQVKGVDNDSEMNSNLTYSLKSENDIDSKNELFKIDQLNGKIQTSKKLIGYSGKLKYSLIISDRIGIGDFLSGNCLIEFIIKDVNIHQPQFVSPDKNSSIIRVKYSLASGSEIITVKAIDQDTGSNGEVFYYLDESRLKNPDWKKFSIQPKTGVLKLKTSFNLNEQSIYSVEIIASDNGKPNQLRSRLTLTIVLVDDDDNSARFEKSEICLFDNFVCDKTFQYVSIKIMEEQDPEKVKFDLGIAKMGDLRKSNKEICYYLIGKDSDLFEIGLKDGTLRPKNKLDRENRDKYDLIVKSYEYCDCKQVKTCNFLSITDENFNPNDPSLLKIKVEVDDINDNRPKFDKKFYQIGITSDIDFGESILESTASDLDLNENLIFSIDNSSIMTNSLDKEFPFVLEYLNTVFNKHSIKNRNNECKFIIKLNKKLRSKFNNSEKNIYYQFNLTVFDLNGLNSSSTVQIVLISKQQRVKLVFSQSIEKVLKFQEEFINYVSNLTGLRSFIDKIRVYRSVDDLNPTPMTEVLMHFVEPKSIHYRLDTNARNINPEYIIIDSETILNILDRSRDANLLKKYKLSLAEKYDYQGSSIYYRYGSDSEEDSGSFFQLSSSSISKLYTKLFIVFLFALLIICSISLFILCFCTRLKYKRKLKAERAIAKAFGFEQRSIAYSDPVGGYLNHAFDSNSLLPIPGTNLYAYEGSNPVWLKKYDKIDCSNNKTSLTGSSSSSTTSESSSASSYSCSYKNKNENFMDTGKDISSFYLKQIDSPSTDFSPVSTSNNSDKNTKNETLTSEILSNISPSSVSNQLKDVNNVSSFKSDNLLTFAPSQNKIITNQNTKQEVFSFKEQIRLLSNQKLKFNNSNEIVKNSSEPEKILFPNNVSNFTKIFDNSLQDTQTDKNVFSSNESKDFSDMFAVESTVI